MSITRYISMEAWKVIPGFEKYEVSDIGQIRRNGNILKQSMHHDGRVFVQLSVEGHRVNIKVHRLVALAFLPNPDNLPTVDHINRDYLDNRLCNLRWYSYSDQLRNRGYKNSLGHRNIRLTSGGKYEVRIYDSGRCVYNKTFTTLNDALEARDNNYSQV